MAAIVVTEITNTDDVFCRLHPVDDPDDFVELDGDAEDAVRWAHEAGHVVAVIAYD